MYEALILFCIQSIDPSIELNKEKERKCILVNTVDTSNVSDCETNVKAVLRNEKFMKKVVDVIKFEMDIDEISMLTLEHSYKCMLKEDKIPFLSFAMK